MGISYIICAAGAGTRMRDVHPKKPKPFLWLNGKSLLEWSLSSLDLYPGDQVIIITQSAQADHNILRLLANEHPDVDFIFHEVPGLTRGQLETALCSKHLWRPGNSLAIFNSDTYFRSRDLGVALRSRDIEGVIPCSKEPGNSWSFCSIDRHDLFRDQVLANVIDVREKERISDWCSVGLYFFRNMDRFCLFAEEELKSQDQPTEYYVAPLYQRYLKNGHTIKAVGCEVFKPMGSLDQIQQYWGLNLAQLRNQNPRGTLVVDLDNTLTFEESSRPYRDKRPRTDVVERLWDYKNSGYKIVIHTSRRMRTHAGDEAGAIADIGLDTLLWRKENKVPFDGIRFGKPYAENAFYIDDKAIRPSEFITESIDELERRLLEWNDHATRQS